MGRPWNLAWGLSGWHPWPQVFLWGLPLGLQSQALIPKRDPALPATP